MTYDLGDVTLMPGLIDTHVHIGYHFGKDGRAQNQGETPAEMALYAAENAWVTLINGFTTVQSVGAASDKELRDAIDRGVLPGPRILSSLGSMNERTGTPDELRAYVRKQKAAGADLIKIFASKSIRDGGAPDDDRRAAGGGVRRGEDAGPAHAGARARAPTRCWRRRKAGCTQVEHGAFVSDEGAEVHGRARRLLRSQHRPRAAELHREQGDVSSASATTPRRASRSWRRRCRPTTRCSSGRSRRR